MRIVAHVSKFYDWMPVPADVVVSKADKAAGRVKLGNDGQWLMRVPREMKSHVQINLPEHQIVAKIIHDKCRPEGGRTLTRKQAVAFYLSEHVMPQQAHRSWITSFEVHDDGPDEALARAMLAPHVQDGTIDTKDVDAHIAAYIESADAEAHVAHLATHFKIVKAVP